MLDPTAKAIFLPSSTKKSTQISRRSDIRDDARGGRTTTDPAPLASSVLRLLPAFLPAPLFASLQRPRSRALLAWSWGALRTGLALGRGGRSRRARPPPWLQRASASFLSAAAAAPPARGRCGVRVPLPFPWAS